MVIGDTRKYIEWNAILCWCKSFMFYNKMDLYITVQSIVSLRSAFAAAAAPNKFCVAQRRPHKALLIHTIWRIKNRYAQFFSCLPTSPIPICAWSILRLFLLLLLTATTAAAAVTVKYLIINGLLKGRNQRAQNLWVLVRSHKSNWILH